jgi:hypothetical protein
LEKCTQISGWENMFTAVESKTSWLDLGGIDPVNTSGYRAGRLQNRFYRRVTVENLRISNQHFSPNTNQ